MRAATLRGPSIVLALALMSGVLVLGQDPLVRTPPAPGSHPLQSLGRPVATATAERPGFDVLVWRRDFTTLSSAEFRDAGKGTDVVLQGKADAMEALLAIDADTSPSSILLSLAADRGLTLGVDGAASGLVAGVPVRVAASFYQSRAGALVKVPGGFVVSGTQIALWSERGAARESLIVSVRATFGTNPEATSAVAAFGAPQLTATVQVDADGNAVASPGDTLRYRLTIPNIGDAAMTNVVANLPLDANTAAVAGSMNVSPIALDQTVTINEDTPTLITLTGSDADGNALTYTVVTQPANGGVVQASPGSAGVTYTPAANFNGTDTFTVRNNDGRVDSNEAATITVTVGPVNDTPSFTKGADATVLEDSGANTVAGWATAISKGGGSDESGQTLTFVVTNNTNPALFATGPAVDATNGNLTFTPEAQAFGTATITLRLDDNGGGANQSPTQTFDITVTGVNDAPSFVKGANQTVLEDAGAQTVNPWATAISPGPNEGTQTVAFAITNNTNAALFSVQPAVSPTGVLTYTPAANANGSATMTLHLADSGGTANLGVDTSAAQTFDITVTADNDAPVADDEAYGVNEGATLTVPAPGVLDGDTDVEGTTLTAQLVTGPAHASSFTLNPDGSFSYTHDGSETPLIDTFTYRASDGVLTSNLATVTITITPINDAPIAGGDAYGVNEGATLTVPLPGVLGNDSDAEGTALTAVLVTGPAHASSFTLNPNGSFTYTHDGSETPLSDTFTYRASDGVLLSNVATVTITITPVNDAPVIDLDADNSGGTTGANYAFTFTEGDPAAFLQDATDAAITDADHTTLTSLKVTLTNRLDPGFEVLDVDLTGFPLFTKDYDITTDPAQGVLTIASATPQPIADYQTLLRRVTYGNTDLGPDPTNRIVTFVANDGTDNSAAATTTITVVSLNTPPTVTAGATLGYTENQVPGVLDAGLTVSDPDNSSLVSATVQITGNYASGEDVLGFADQSGITGLWDSGSGTLTLTGSATVANYQAALRTVTYVNGSDNPSTAARTVTWSVNDGTDPSTPATSTVTVAAVNDNPVADDDAYGVNEGATLTVPAPGVLDGDTDAEGSSLTAQLVTGPAHASSFTLNPDGSFSYTHDGSETLTDTFTYRAFDGALQSNTATVTIAITPINDAPLAGDNAYGVNEGATLTIGLPGVLVNDTDAEGTPLTAQLVTGPAHALSFTLNPDGSFSYTHDGSETPLSDTFTYRAFDGALLSNVATVTITITPVNDPPVVNLDADDSSGATGGNYKFTFTEGDPTTFLQDATDATITDADTTTLTSLKVTLTNRLDPGFEVLDVDLTGFPAFAKDYDITTTPAQGVLTITATPAQPIADWVTVLRLVTYSNTDAGPNPADRIVTFVANDGTSNSAAATTTITVITQNNAPVAVADGYGVNEGGTLAPVAPGVLGNDTDADGDTLTAVLVTGPSHASSFTLNPDGSFTYVHDGNGFAADSFTYKANDGIVDSNDVIVTITVTSVNDAPSFVKGADVTVLEDSGLHTEAGWATAISPGGAEESAQVLTFNASNNNNALFSAQPAVAADGTLTFTPAANAFGAATVTLALSDDGGVLNGGVDTSAPQTFVITVTGVNDPPSFTKGADQTVLEDSGLHSVPGWATAISPGPLESDLLTFNVSNDNTALFSVQPAVAANGTLTYTLAADQFGSTTVSVSLTDDGSTPGVPGDDLTTAVQTFTITVTPVNDAPSFTAGATETVPEDSGAQTVPGWATAISVGPANESSQTPSFTVTNLSVPGTLTFLAGPAVAPDGTLTYTPAPNAFGLGTFNVILSDGGGTANGGVETVTHTLTIDVTAVNDAPTFAPGVNQTVNEDSGGASVSNFITAISPGPNETGQTVTLTITGNDNSALFSAQPAFTGSGATRTLTFTPALNAFGVATLTYHASDNGGIANGGVDTSTPDSSFTITVNPINDPPVVTGETFDVLGNTQLRVDIASVGTPFTSETTTGPSSVKGVLDNDSDPVEGDPITITAITGCADVSLPIDCTLPGGAVVHVEATGEFSFTPAPGATTGSFTYTVTDQPSAGSPASVQGTVTFTFFDMIWYVDADAPGGGNGTSSAPFNNLDSLDGAGGAGDSDLPGHYIFVHGSTANLDPALAAGLELEANQHLISEFQGLSIPRNLNGNGSPTILVAANGARPLITNPDASASAITIGAAMPAEIRGFALSATSNAIDLTTAAPLTGSATLAIANNEIRSAGAEGIDVNLNAGTTGTLALDITSNTWDTANTHTGNAVDVNHVAGAGTLNLNISNNTNIVSSAAAVVINGGSVANTTITGLANNTVHANTAGNGIVISAVTFDSDLATGGIQQVNGGTLAVATDGDGVGGAGLSLTTVQGNLFFNDLDVYGGTTGLTMTGTGSGMTLAVTPNAGSEIKGANGAAVNIATAAIDLRLSELASTTTGSAVNLDTVSGQFSAASGSAISKASGGGTAFAVSNSSATVDYGGTMNVTSTGPGIALATNTGAINFTGLLTLSTGASSAFSATGANGTVTATNTANTLTTTTGTALNVNGPDIALGGLVFRSIASNGAASGIILQDTGTTAGLSVLGTGAAASGGVINASTGPGISLTNTIAVNLTRMNIQNGGDDGIRGSGVNGFNLTNVNVTSNGNAVGERGIELLQLSGTGSMNTVAVTGSAESQVRIENDTANLTSFNVTNSTFSTTNFTFGDDGFIVLNTGSASMTVSVTGSTFTDNKGDHFQAATDADATGPMNITFNNNTLSTTGANDPNVVGGGITVNTSGSTDITFQIDGNNLQQAFDDAININLDPGSLAGASMNGTINNNTIGTSGSAASGSESSNTITVAAKGQGLIDVDVMNNQIFEWGNQYGIFVGISEGAGAHMVAKVTGNTLHATQPNVLLINGIRVDAGATAGDAGTLEVVLTGNDVTGEGNVAAGDADIRLRQRFNTTIKLPGYGGANTDTAAVNAFVAANNDPVGATPAPSVSSAQNVGGGGGGFIGGSATPLLAAAGGVDAARPGSVPVLTQAELDVLVTAAIDRWIAAGLKAEQVAAMRKVKFETADLQRGYLAAVEDNRVIKVDRDAGGDGWFVDPTPMDDAEFPDAVSDAPAYSDAAGEPAGRMDLLTAVMHELGHRVGLPDVYRRRTAGDLMYGYLTKGERRVPQSNHVTGVSPAPPYRH